MKSILIIGNLVLSQASIKLIDGGYRITGIPVRNVKKELLKPRNQLVYRAGRFGGRGGWIRLVSPNNPSPKYVYSHGRGGRARRRILNKSAVYNWRYSSGRMGHSRFILRQI